MDEKLRGQIKQWIHSLRAEGLQYIDEEKKLDGDVEDFFEFCKVAGYVELAEDQSLPCVPDSAHLDDLGQRVFRAGYRDLIAKGWRKIEEVK